MLENFWASVVIRCQGFAPLRRSSNPLYIPLLEMMVDAWFLMIRSIGR